MTTRQGEKAHANKTNYKANDPDRRNETTGRHLHISRTYIVHDRVAKDVLFPGISGNTLTARSDDEGEFGGDPIRG